MEALAQKFENDQKEINKCMAELQQLEVQFQESKIVKEEFAQLKDESAIFKLVGPVLVPQDRNEAKTNVDKRLEFITSQKSQVEKKIETLKQGLFSMQAELRERQAALGATAAQNAAQKA